MQFTIDGIRCTTLTVCFLLECVVNSMLRMHRSTLLMMRLRQVNTFDHILVATLVQISASLTISVSLR